MEESLQIVLIVVLCVIAVALLVLAGLAVVRFVCENRKCARVEGKWITDSRRIVWRIVNTGVRDITIVEIGIRCADKQASHRPLYSATDDGINCLPQVLHRGEIASYRKEMERFMFRQSEADALKVSNPAVYFYAKDAEGKIYTQKSDYNFVQYLTMQIGGTK